jgi:magnesium-transporting ATPase (P-type)
MTFNDILLWMFVINLGVAFGAGIYEQRIVVPQWFSRSSKNEWRVDDEAMRRTDTGRSFWAFVTTVPLTLLTFASIAVAWDRGNFLKQWWLAAAVITLLERIITFRYFIPTALKLMQAGAASTTRSAMASQWMRLNLLRAALVSPDGLLH